MTARDDRTPAIPNGARSRCWLWPGFISRQGYGRIFRTNKPSLAAHRVLWEAVRGPIPKHLQIDHLCRNRACVNPNHMRLVTTRENVLCGVGPTAVNARRTHCPKGHAYQGANLRVIGGKRYCRACCNARTLAWEHAGKRKSAK